MKLKFNNQSGKSSFNMGVSISTLLFVFGLGVCGLFAIVVALLRASCLLRVVTFSGFIAFAVVFRSQRNCHGT